MASAHTKNEKEILAKLAELGGQRVTDDSITQEGTKIVIPETMTKPEVVRFLKKSIEQDEEITEFSKTFKFRPWDGAHALEAGMKRVFGTTGIQRGTATMFGTNPPERRTIPIGPNETIQVPWGQVEVPIFEGIMTLSAVKDDELGQLFHLYVQAPRKCQDSVEGLFQVVQNELETNSIYRGKAIDGQEMPEFLNLDGIDPERVIYSNETMEHLDANIWAPIKFDHKLRELDVPLKRAVLLEGPYGTGKTLGAFLTAQICVAQEEPWTFVYCRPGKDDIFDVLATARLYAPAVVFYEDVDTLSEEANDPERVSKLLDAFDGITSKTNDIMIIMTTNHKDRILKGMLRPGRLDAMIHIGALDQNGIQNMILTNVHEDLLSDDLDYYEIAQAMRVGQETEDGESLAFLPAFVKEAIRRAIGYAIVRTNGEPSKLGTKDFVLAAHGLYAQFDQMIGAAERRQKATLDDALGRSVVKAIHGAKVSDDRIALEVDTSEL
ncbi:MAG: ATP-binding protein [Proteobacteria bacterium]|nr:ATP-binding protein [Pseudomonadota bacterium]